MSLREENLSWVRGVFGAAPQQLGRRRSGLDSTTSATLKFADTTIGGNAAINAPPQFTRYADIAATGLFATSETRTENGLTSAMVNEENEGSYRMGRFYSEKHDDTAHYVHMRFGVPKYTGTIAFFANMYDRDAARLAREGEYSTVARTLGTVAGFGALVSLVPLPVLIPLVVTGQVLKFALGKKPSRYYYLKETMNTYLQAVQAILDTQLLHYRLVPMWDVVGEDRYIDILDKKNKQSADMTAVYEALPDIWKSNGKFDVYKMLTRYQTLANYQTREINRIYEKANDSEEFEAALNAYLEYARSSEYLKDAVTDEQMSLQNLVSAYTNNPLYQVSGQSAEEEKAQWEAFQKAAKGSDGISADTITLEQTATSQIAALTPDQQKNQTNETFWDGVVGFFSDSAEQLDAELKDGGQWVTFKVDAKASVSDSFSNSSKDPDIKSKLNGLTAQAREMTVSASGGKTGFDFVDGAISGVKNFLGGTVDALHLTGLAAIYGSSYTDIPEVWESSQTSLGSQSISIPLRSTYGDDLSLFQNIAVPLAFIIAMVAPLSTGKQTYTSPFLCEMYCRGRQNVRLGMVESVQITRGVGNKGWREDGKMLGCDVTITVKDLSKVMSMPIINDPGWFDDDNMFTDYMATIGGASLQDLTYAVNKLAFNMNKWKQSWKSAFMSGRITNSVSNLWPLRQLAGLTSGTAL